MGTFPDDSSRSWCEEEAERWREGCKRDGEGDLLRYSLGFANLWTSIDVPTEKTKKKSIYFGKWFGKKRYYKTYIIQKERGETSADTTPERPTRKSEKRVGINDSHQTPIKLRIRRSRYVHRVWWWNKIDFCSFEDAKEKESTESEESSESPSIEVSTIVMSMAHIDCFSHLLKSKEEESRASREQKPKKTRKELRLQCFSDYNLIDDDSDKAPSKNEKGRVCRRNKCSENRRRRRQCGTKEANEEEVRNSRVLYMCFSETDSTTYFSYFTLPTKLSSRVDKVNLSG